ncbi:MAG: hypothetical protein R3C02_09040 [Planctomycetaceae bacterium]
MPVGASIRQKNAYTVAPFRPKEPLHSLRCSAINFSTLSNSVPPTSPPPHQPRRASTVSLVMARHPRPVDSNSTSGRSLNEVKDEQLYNITSGIVDLGYVYDIRLRAGVVTITLTMPPRPPGVQLPGHPGWRPRRERHPRTPARSDGVQDVVIDFHLGTRMDNAAQRCSEKGA